MRFAWLQKKSDDFDSIKQGYAHPLALIRMAYNAVFWVFLLPFVTMIDYSTGFIAFSVVILVRLAVNIYTNNFLNFGPEQYERFPFRP